MVNGRNYFKEGLDGLDEVTSRAVIKRIVRLQDGNLGDHRFAGMGVWELRIHLGAGYRVYYAEDALTIVLFLCGGDKGSQASDIQRARKLWARYRQAK